MNIQAKLRQAEKEEGEREKRARDICLQYEERNSPSCHLATLLQLQHEFECRDDIRIEHSQTKLQSEEIFT